MVTKSKLKMALLSEKQVDLSKLGMKLKTKKAVKLKAKKGVDLKQSNQAKTEQDWEDIENDENSSEKEEKNMGDESEHEDEGNDGNSFSMQACSSLLLEANLLTFSQSNLAGIDESDSDSSNCDNEEDIPVSDLDDIDEEDKEDLIPHQRLTINNTLALSAALKRISIPISKLPFSEHQSITSSTPVSIPDVSDDLNRELAFYSQCLSAAQIARQKLKDEGVPFTRPTDYFAEMVKADEHMLKIKAKLIDEAASKKASAEARKQRDLKKFGKQVQVAKLQERDKERKQTLEKIKLLKRSRFSPSLKRLAKFNPSTERQGADTENANEADMFDVAVDEEIGSVKQSRKDSGAQNKRQKKDGKFGFGGKKRFKKSGDAASSGDLRAFSVKKMKGGAKVRPGKSRRASKKY